MKDRECAGGVVRNVRGEIALVKSGESFWGFPKGHLDPGEDALTAAKREIIEETGLTQLEYRGNLGSYRRMGGRDMREPKVIHMFLFSTAEERLAPLDPHNPEARWVAPPDVSALLTNTIDREFFESQLPLPPLA